MSPGSLPMSGTDENPHSNSPKTTIAIPAKTRLFPIGAIAVLPLARLYKTGCLGNTRPNNRLRGARHRHHRGGCPLHPVRSAKLRAARYFALRGGGSMACVTGQFIPWVVVLGGLDHHR